MDDYALAPRLDNGELVHVAIVHRPDPDPSTLTTTMEAPHD